jgi:DNA modification methylase
MNYLPLTSIVIDLERLRKDMGDIETFAHSIRAARRDLVETKGLLHPIVLDADNKLIGGGRRMTAFQWLHNEFPTEGWDSIPFLRVEQLAPSVRRKLELEENIRRKTMSWQEEIVGIYDYHRQCVREGIKDGVNWTQTATGEVLGVDQTSVSNALKLAKHIIKDPNGAVAKAENAFGAMQLLSKAALDEAAREQLRRIQVRQAEAGKNVELAKATVGVTVLDVAKISLPTPLSPVEKPVLTHEQIASFYYHGNALDLIPQIAKSTVINHIITDPPYGIDMANIDTGATGKIDRVAATHEVEPNLQLLEAFLDVAFRHIADDGFLCLWYDLDHHEKLQAWATKIGWRVCRWPLVWCKSSPCVNNAASYNITKATEVCMFLRRSEKSLIKQKLAKNWFVADAVRDASHPFVKPSECWTIPLNSVSTEGQTILDPFAGQGSSLVSIFRNKRNPIGVEVDQTHIANGLNYIQTRLGKPSESEVINGLLSDCPL